MEVKKYRFVDTMAKENAKKMPCVVCARFESDPHHLISRGAGGHDFDWNLMPLCRSCHTEVHKKGLVTCSKKYTQVSEWLINNGWVLNEYNKWKHE